MKKRKTPEGVGGRSSEKPRDRINELWKMFNEQREGNCKDSYDEIVTELLFEILISLKCLRTFCGILLGLLVATLLF